MKLSTEAAECASIGRGAFQSALKREARAAVERLEKQM